MTQQGREIRYVKDNGVDVDLLTLIAVMIERADNEPAEDGTAIDHAEVSDWGEKLAKRVLCALQPYLRTSEPGTKTLLEIHTAGGATKPVSVDLDDVALWKEHKRRQHSCISHYEFRKITKAVLDAAGVKYHED